jgi:hypothetical protein
VLVCTQAIGAATANNTRLNAAASIVFTLQWTTLILLFWFWCACLSSHLSIPQPASYSAVIVKIIIGLQLVVFAIRRQETTRARELEDAVNDYGRPPIGETQEEKVSQYLHSNVIIIKLQARNNVIRDLLQESRPNGVPGGAESLNTSGKKKFLKLEEVTRFTMTKRIW